MSRPFAMAMLLLAHAAVYGFVHLATASPPSAQADTAAAPSTQEGLRLAAERGGALGAVAVTGPWLYASQHGRIHALRLEGDALTHVATSLPWEKAPIAALDARDDVVVAAGRELRSYRREGETLRQVSRSVLRVAIDSVHIVGERLWLRDTTGRLLHARLAADGSIGARQAWAPPPPLPGGLATITRVRTGPQPGRLLLHVSWELPEPGSGSRRQEARVLELDARAVPPRIMAQASTELLDRVDVVADASSLLVVDVSGRPSPLAERYVRGPGGLRPAARPEWSGSGTWHVAAVDGALYRVDHDWALHRHASLDSDTSSRLRSFGEPPHTLFGVDGRLAILTRRGMWWLDPQSGRRGAMLADEVPIFAQVAATADRVWLRADDGALLESPIDVRLPWPAEAVPAAPYDTQGLLAHGERVYLARNGRIEIRHDTGAGEASLGDTLPSPGADPLERVLDAHADRVIAQDGDGSTWLLQATIDGRGARTMSVAQADVAAARLEGDALWTLSGVSFVPGLPLAPELGLFDIRSAAGRRVARVALPTSVLPSSSFAASGLHAFVGTGSLLSALDMHVPRMPTESDVLDLPGRIEHVALAGNLAWVRWSAPGAGGGGVTAIDVSNPRRLRDLGHMALSSDPAPAPLFAEGAGVWLVDGGALRHVVLEGEPPPAPTLAASPTATATPPLSLTTATPTTPPPSASPTRPPTPRAAPPDSRAYLPRLWR